MIKILKKKKIYTLLRAVIIPTTIIPTTMSMTSCSVARILFEAQGQKQLYLTSTPKVTHTLVVQNIDLHGATFTYEIIDTNISGIDITDPTLVSYVINEDYIDGNMNINYSLSSIFYETVTELPENERNDKFISLKTTFQDAGKTVVRSITSKFTYDRTPIIKQTINVSSENGINPATYYSGEKFAAGKYNAFDAIGDYAFSDPNNFTMDEKQKICDILNADIANTIDRTIDNFRYWISVYEFNFDVLDINWSYEYDASTAEFTNIELTGNCKCSLFGASVIFNAKFRNCKLIGAFNENKSFGSPHQRYDGKEVYANMLQFVPLKEDDVDVTYSINFVVPFIGLNINYNEKYFLNPRNFFGVEKFDTHGSERGFALMSYYLSNYQDNNVDWLNNPPTPTNNPLQVNISPILLSTSIVNLKNVYVKNNWTHSDIDGGNTRKSTKAEFEAGNEQDGFTSRHVLIAHDSNPQDGCYSDWVHTPSEFLSCFPNTNSRGHTVNSFKEVTINGKTFPWYHVFNLIEYTKENGTMSFDLNSIFLFNDSNHTKSVAFEYAD